MSTSTSSSTSSSVRSATTSSTTRPVTAAVSTPPTTAPTGPPDPPDPRDAYVPKALPPGITANISGCRWVPDRGGEVQAEGTITNTAGSDDFWLITAVWLRRNRTQDESSYEQNDVIEVPVGRTIPWRLAIAAPAAPHGLSCAFEAQ
jgi:hypothetical protein